MGAGTSRMTSHGDGGGQHLSALVREAHKGGSSQGRRLKEKRWWSLQGALTGGSE